MPKFIVTLTEEERSDLHRLIRAGSATARKRLHAQVLVQADASLGGPDGPDQRIHAALHVSPSTVHRVRQRFVEESLEAALSGRPVPRRPDKGKRGAGLEAHLIALACSDPPAGRARWTVRLLADRLVEAGRSDGVSEETVRKALKKAPSTWPR
jgi:hypothetical protein